jgi:hypothetical protein
VTATATRKSVLKNKKENKFCKHKRKTEDFVLKEKIKVSKMGVVEVNEYLKVVFRALDLVTKDSVLQV